MPNQSTNGGKHKVFDNIKESSGHYLASYFKSKPKHLTASGLSKRDRYPEQQAAIAAIYYLKQQLNELLS